MNFSILKIAPPLLLVLPFVALGGTAFLPSDCGPGRQDSTCIKVVNGGDVPPWIPQARLLYDGPLAGVPATDFHYWGFDFQTEDGIYAPVQRSMFVNRSNELVSITLTFDIPTGPCDAGCLPGVEFKVGAWHTFFPNIVKANGTAEATLEVGPNDSYGWVIGLWRATNPRLSVTAHGTTNLSMRDIGLPLSPDSLVSTPGVIYPCACPDGSTGECFTGPQYSTGYVGPWSHDFYQQQGAGNTCPTPPPH
jgi:hypothetical protein